MTKLRLVPRPETRVVRPTFVDLYRDHFDFVWRVLARLGVPDRDLADAASPPTSEGVGCGSLSQYQVAILPSGTIVHAGMKQNEKVRLGHHDHDEPDVQPQQSMPLVHRRRKMKGR